MRTLNLPVLAAGLLLTACASSSNPAVNAPAPVMTGDTFELRVGASAEIGTSGVIVTFQKVSGDSRCPKGATCVWAGDAVVLLAVGRKGEEPVTLELHTALGMKKDEARHEGMTIRLVELKPYPVGDEKIIADRYAVVLRTGG